MSEPNSPELEPDGEQPHGRPRATLDDFGAVDWQAAVAGVPFRRLYEYAGRFNDLAKEASAAGKAREAAVYQSLADVCWLVLREDSPEDPFAPFMVSPAFRTGGIEDLSSETVAACSAFASQVNDPKLRARLADVAWVRARDYQAGKLAVASYLVLAEPIEPANWPEQLSSIERALAIALQFGRGNQELGQVARFIEALIRRYHATDEGFLCAKLMELLLAFGGVDAAEFAHLAESLACRALSAKDFHRSREYWSLAADWASRAKNPEQRRFFLQQLGESYVSEAEEALDRPAIGPLLAAGHLQRAIVSLREAGGSRARVDELRARLVSIQPAAVANIPTISHKFDITDYVLQAEQSVAGKALPESLLALARGAPVLFVEELRKTAQGHTERYQLASLFPKVIHSATGKVIARQGSITSTDPTEREAALRFEMVALAAQYHETLPQMTIDPMRRQIIREHPVRAGDLLPLLRYSPIVPLGRERIIADGLVAGFYGEMVQATHLLVPQLEQSIRMLLHHAGEQVSTFDAYGIQKELNLNNLLYLPKLKAMLGEDLVFTLQALLVEPPGANIRNGMAHGLMSHAEFFSGSAMYLWWLSARLCLLSGLVRLEEGARPAQETEAS